ncbi:hypothetical protein IWW47_000662 [Coemansia sp. RSA 2052]|nr:hypothetical protein IWW47_000662 [Coemansia sp. RSA 2052]
MNIAANRSEDTIAGFSSDGKAATNISNGDETTASSDEETAADSVDSSASSDLYSIASMEYDPDDCVSFQSYESELSDSDSVLSIEYSYADVVNYDSDSCSVMSSSSGASVLSGEVHPVKTYFHSLSTRERSTLDSALRLLLLWSSGTKLTCEQHEMLYRVILIAYKRRQLGKAATPMTLLMAAAINIMGVDDALYWVAPEIEKYNVKYLYKQNIELAFA